jgi:transcriptional regulatory protein LevR
MKQVELAKRDYIKRLKSELDLIENRYKKIIDETTMIAEENRTHAVRNFEKVLDLNRTINNLKQIIHEHETVIA